MTKQEVRTVKVGHHIEKKVVSFADDCRFFKVMHICETGGVIAQCVMRMTACAGDDVKDLTAQDMVNDWILPVGC